MSQDGVSGTKFFGVIAMGMGMITKDQLEECLETQRESTVPRRLGAIMRARGYLTGDQIKEILAVQGKTKERSYKTPPKHERVKLLGEILVDLGYIDRGTLRTAIRQYESFRREGRNPQLVKILTTVGEITPAQVEEAVSAIIRELE